MIHKIFLRLNVKCLSKCVEGWYSSRDSKPGKVVYTTNVTCNRDGIKALLLRQNFDWSSNWCSELRPPHCGAAEDEPQQKTLHNSACLLRCSSTTVHNSARLLRCRSRRVAASSTAAFLLRRCSSCRGRNLSAFIRSPCNLQYICLKDSSLSKQQHHSISNQNVHSLINTNNQTCKLNDNAFLHKL